MQSQNQNQNGGKPVQRKPPAPPAQPKAQAKPREKTQQELDDELRKIARAKKFGGGDSMDTS
jgi:hypothetical protein